MVAAGKPNLLGVGRDGNLNAEHRAQRTEMSRRIDTGLELQRLMKMPLPTKMEDALRWYFDLEAAAHATGVKRGWEVIEAWLGTHDLFYLLAVLLNRHDIIKPWLFARCREVQEDPNDHLDLWAREHYKSTIITFGLTIFDILKDPEITVGIFSHTSSIATAFLRQIKMELETNERLYALYPDVLYQWPARESPKWSEKEGIIVKRKSNPKEATIEAWGLVDGQPTALACDTPVLTTDGWKCHGDLCHGDWVYGEDGWPVKVIHNTGPMLGKRCIDIRFDDTDIVAADDHLWPVDRAISPRDLITGRQDTGWSIVQREIVRTVDLPLSAGPERDKRRRLLATPVLQGSIRQEILGETLPIDPYILGWWLGDGSSDGGIITTGDYEVLPSFEAAGFPVVVAQDRGKYKMFRLLGLREKLKAMGLLWNKHIPDAYLYAHESDRLSLFQGLMDSDGSCRPSGGWGQSVFTNTNTLLIEQAHFVAASLGIKPARIAWYHDGNPDHNPRGTFSFTGTLLTPPFRLVRKLAGCMQKRKNCGRYVRELKETASVPVNCIQVEAENGVYLAGRSLVPTHNSKHFKLRVYDDVVTRESVQTPEAIKKTLTAWELSDNLGVSARAGGRVRYIGTRYSLYDCYSSMIIRKVVKTRLHPATHNGRFDGSPVFLSEQDWQTKVRTQGRSTIAAQLLQNPMADEGASFRPEWLRAYEVRPRTLNVYIMCDPSRGRSATSDNTAIAVVGIGAGGTKYLLDGACHRMTLSQRWLFLRGFYRRWSAVRGVQRVAVGYERYGAQSDDEYFQEQMELDYRRKVPDAFFQIEELNWPREGGNSKQDRVERLEPDFRNGRFFLPLSVMHEGKPSRWKVDSDPSSRSFGVIEYQAGAGLTRLQMQALEGGSPDLICKPIIVRDPSMPGAREGGGRYDVTTHFMDEYMLFPFGQWKDLIDSVSRIYDMDPTAPLAPSARTSSDPTIYADGV